MKFVLTGLAIVLPGAAFAHVGHLGELAGHDHLVAGIALGAAVGVAVWGWLKGSDDAQEDEEIENEEAEA